MNCNREEGAMDKPALTREARKALEALEQAGAWDELEEMASLIESMLDAHAEEAGT